MVVAFAENLALFLHVLGVMSLFGAVLATLVIALSGKSRAAFTALLVAVAAWVLAFAGGNWVASEQHLSNSNATWINIGHVVLEGGLIVLLATLGVAFWWRRSGKARAGQITAGLCSLYLLMLAVAWLAMSGKWGGAG